MKIGLLLSYLYSAERYNKMVYAPLELLINLADELVNRGHEVYVYSTSNVKTKANLISGNKLFEEKDYPTASDLIKGQEVGQLLSKLRTFLENDVSLASLAIKHAEENNLDVLHVMQSRYFPYLSRFSKIPFLTTLHDPPPKEETIDFLRLMGFNNQNYVAISQSNMNEYSKIDVDCFDYVYHGLNLNEFVFSEEGGEEMAFIGRSRPQKGMVDAILISEKLHCKLKMATGDDEEKNEYFKKEVRPKIDNNSLVELHEFLRGDKRNLFLDTSKLLLFPIHWEEPFGLVQIESMACGTPVVAFARGSAPEIIKDGETGFIVNSSDDDIRGDFIIKKTGFEGICEAVQMIYSLPQMEYKEMRRKCRQHVENNFTIQKMTDNYERVYQDVRRKFNS
jgi:glycosyltransferase involved in cell wall biosynthesis